MIILFLIIQNLSSCNLSINFIQNGSIVSNIKLADIQEVNKQIRLINREPIDIEVIGQTCPLRYKVIKAIIPDRKNKFSIEIYSQPYMLGVR